MVLLDRKNLEPASAIRYGGASVICTNNFISSFKSLGINNKGIELHLGTLLEANAICRAIMKNEHIKAYLLLPV